MSHTKTQNEVEEAWLILCCFDTTKKIKFYAMLRCVFFRMLFFSSFFKNAVDVYVGLYEGISPTGTLYASTLQCVSFFRWEFWIGEYKNTYILHAWWLTWFAVQIHTNLRWTCVELCQNLPDTYENDVLYVLSSLQKALILYLFAFVSVPYTTYVPFLAWRNDWMRVLVVGEEHPKTADVNFYRFVSSTAFIF